MFKASVVAKAEIELFNSSWVMKSVGILEATSSTSVFVANPLTSGILFSTSVNSVWVTTSVGIEFFTVSISVLKVEVFT